ncbi:MAG: Bug family tripartite tricarboxylate transporter substrate binding protein [Hyphomicrobiaceae bacterium]
MDADPSRLRFRSLLGCAVAGACLAASGPAVAEEAPNLAGRTVQMLIGFGAGSGYDTWARLVARHIGEHLPGKPQVVPQNMKGAGSLIAANNIYNVAPKDGTVIAAISRDAALQPLSGAKGARFDATKFTWLGTPTTETNVCVVFHTAKAKTIDDIFKVPVILGDTGVGTGTYAYPKALNGLLGSQFKLVSGFHASSDVFLAIDRGEVEGICESYSSAIKKRPDWIREKKLRFLFQGGAEPDPALKHIPFILDYAKTAEQKQAIKYLYAGQGFGRPFIAPPALSPAVRDMLTNAFDATMKDPDFLAEAKKSKLDVEPVSGKALQKLVEEIYTTPRAVIDKVAKLIK